MKDFSRALASLADVYVDDAFGAAHRAHASIAGMTAFFKAKAAGLLMQKELDYLSPLLAQPEKPFVTILGGAKVSDKIGVIKNLLPKVIHSAHRRRHGLHVFESNRNRNRQILSGARQAGACR